MPLPKEHVYTSEDYWNLPEGQRAELIDGQLYDLAALSQVHQELVGEFYRVIRNYIIEKHGGCKVFPAPFAVNLNADDSVYLEPDVFIVCDPKKLDGHKCNGAPDFVVEIVSPSSRRMDYNRKNTLYSEAGVREYWIVDPSRERTTVYHYEEDAAPTIIPFRSPLPVGIYNGDLTITISDLL